MKRSIIITCSILLGILLSQTQQAKAQGSVKLVSDTESYVTYDSTFGDWEVGQRIDADSYVGFLYYKGVSITGFPSYPSEAYRYAIPFGTSRTGLDSGRLAGTSVDLEAVPKGTEIELTLEVWQTLLPVQEGEYYELWWPVGTSAPFTYTTGSPGGGDAAMLHFEPFTVTSIPEPGTLALAGIGLAALACASYRRKAHS